MKIRCLRKVIKDPEENMILCAPWAAVTETLSMRTAKENLPHLCFNGE